MKVLEVVCAVIKNDNNQYFVCQRALDKSNGGLFEFPGGKVEIGESQKAALKREIKEELNTTVRVGKYLMTAYHNVVDKDMTIALSAYECKVIKGNFELLEHIEARWLNKEELKNIKMGDADKLILEYL